MRGIRLGGLAACLAVASLPTLAQGTATGQWLTQDNDAVIAIAPCGPALCGRIVGITLDRPDDPIPTDRQGRSQCGLIIIRDAVREGSASWAARIMDPRDGKEYRARMHVDEQGRLRVRGYLGIPLFGQTQVWTPFRGRIAPDCRLPPL